MPMFNPSGPDFVAQASAAPIVPTYLGRRVGVQGGAVVSFSSLIGLPNSASRQIDNGVATDGNSGAGKTLILKLALPVVGSPAIRVKYQNHLAVAITDVKALASSSANPAENFNNAGAHSAVTVGGASTFTIPAGTTAKPAVLRSDWIPVIPLARSDSGPSTLYFARTFVPIANANIPITANNSGTNGSTSWNPVANQEFRTSVNVGDFVASPAGYTEAGVGAGPVVTGIEYITPGGAISIATFGDSIAAGTQATRINCNAVALAAESISTPTLPVSVSTYAQSGTTSDAYCGLAEWYIPLEKPLVAFYPVFSPNDGVPSAAIVASQKAKTLRFLKVCRESGTTPILVTGLPRTTNNANTTSAYSNAECDLARGLNDWARAIAVAGYALLVDADRVLSSNSAAGTPWLWKDTLVQVDGLHPNSTGYALLESDATYGTRAALRRLF